MAKQKTSFFLLFCMVVLLIGGGYVYIQNQKEASYQAQLEPFYIPPNPLPSGNSGDIIRYEPLSVPTPYGTGYRILYMSERTDGKKVATSGTIFIPTGSVPTNGRPVVAWAHGTVGMGSVCAPSRAQNPFVNISWLSEMLQRGYIVVATDYYGLGTPGVQRYLIGKDEAYDVLNSVRAAEKFPDSNASRSFALWGLSQGGHAVLFAASLAADYVPEFHLAAVAAAAPAAQLSALMSQQYNLGVSWIIGPEIAVSWPIVYPDVILSDVVSGSGLRNYKRIAQKCVLQEVGEATIREDLKDSFFRIDPDNIPSWNKAFSDQTPNPLPKNISLLVVQSLSDTVVLPNTTALFNKRLCDGGSNITMMWLSDVAHQNTANVAGPTVASWFEDRFNGLPVQSTCTQPSPAAPFGS